MNDLSPVFLYWNAVIRDGYIDRIYYLIKSMKIKNVIVL